MENKEPIVFDNNFGYLPGVQAAITISRSQDIFETSSTQKVEVKAKNQTEGRKVVPWGADNKLPQTIMEKVYKTPMLTSGMLFNIEMGYGDGILPMYIDYDAKGNKIILPFKLLGRKLKDEITAAQQNEQAPLKKRYKVWENTYEEVTRFFEDNDIDGWLLEALTDLNWFYNVFVEIVSNLESGDKRKIVELVHKEAIFSRWEEMDPKTGIIEKHYYSTKWAEPQELENNVFCTPSLNQFNPLKDLKKRWEDQKGEAIDQRENRWIVPVNFPTPGRTYYQKPYWYSLIESGWYDFALAVPEAKKYIMSNMMLLQYHIELSDEYFPIIFKTEGIANDKVKQKARVKQEFDNINAFLSGTSNHGKSVISYTKFIGDKPLPTMKISNIQSQLKGGEFNDDVEEVSNIMSYGIGVHPSTIGSAPGKNGQINGTEARELFILKQALTKPIRDRILRPLYVIKGINGWDPELRFIIPNITLTTLDKDPTGQKKTATA
jgi:hypothetical protein